MYVNWPNSLEPGDDDICTMFVGCCVLCVQYDNIYNNIISNVVFVFTESFFGFTLYVFSVAVNVCCAQRNAIIITCRWTYWESKVLYRIEHTKHMVIKVNDGCARWFVYVMMRDCIGRLLNNIKNKKLKGKYVKKTFGMCNLVFLFSGIEKIVEFRCIVHMTHISYKRLFVISY